MKIKEKFLIKCPICGSDLLGPNGTQKRNGTRVESFQCKNLHCEFRKTHHGGKQFTLTSSYSFQKVIRRYVAKIVEKISQARTKKVEIAREYGISPELITFLKNKYLKALEKFHSLNELVLHPQIDSAIAIDETFLTIEAKDYYLILATGYKTHRVLGLRISSTRKEKDIRTVFDEAEKNTQNPISLITVDGWGASRTMAKNLGRPITLVVHKHKRPYDKAVIFRFDYENDKRIVTEVGVKTDFFKRRGKREYYRRTREESLIPPPKMKRGRPKGVKNGQGKKQRKRKKPKKRGRKGLFAVFDKGKRGYARVDPHRKTVRIGRDVPPAVGAALRGTMNFFSYKFIQNNLAENKNSVISSHLVLSGPRTPEAMERNLRAFFLIQNHPELLREISIEHQFQSKFLYSQILNSPLLEVLC